MSSVAEIDIHRVFRYPSFLYLGNLTKNMAPGQRGTGSDVASEKLSRHINFCCHCFKRFRALFFTNNKETSSSLIATALSRSLIMFTRTELKHVIVSIPVQFDTSHAPQEPNIEHCRRFQTILYFFFLMKCPKVFRG